MSKKVKEEKITGERKSRRSFLKTAAVATGAAAGVMGFPGVMRLHGGGPDQMEDADLLGRRNGRLHQVPGFRQESGRDDRGTAPDRMPARRRHRRDLRDVRRREIRRVRRLPQLRRLLARQDSRGHLPLLLPLRHGPSRPVGHLVSGPRAARRSPARPTGSTT